MSIRQGDKVIAGKSTYRPSLFDVKWSDHVLTDSSWILASNFDWYNSLIYVVAYQHLFNDLQGSIVNINLYAWLHYDGSTLAYTTSGTPNVGDTIYDENFNAITTIESITSTTQINVTMWDIEPEVSFTRKTDSDFIYTKTVIAATPETETIAGIDITFYRAEDGHKIILADQESIAQNIYDTVGVAWYYIIDTTNKRFKLPRTKFGFEGIRTGVGGYIEAGLPNITGNINLSSTQLTGDGAFSTWQSGGAQGWDGWNTYGNRGFSFDASRLSSIYGSSNTVQESATEMYLYFYAGTFEELSIENPQDIVHKSGDETITGQKTFTASVKAPTPTTSSNDNNVATTSWVNNIDNDVVHKSGDETITGIKIFKSSDWEQINIDNPNSTADEIPTANSGKTIMFRDKNGIDEGYIEFWHNGNAGTRSMGMNICKNNDYTNGIHIGYNNQDQIYTYAPTPATTSNDNNIATTAYVINILKTIYPIGSIYLGTTSACPLATLFGTWTLVSQDRVLQGSSSNHAANSTIEAGLPNITGWAQLNDDLAFQNASGAMYLSNSYSRDVASNRSSSQNHNVNIDASRSSAIYGKSTTVQPPAYVVNVWRRTA